MRKHLNVPKRQVNRVYWIEFYAMRTCQQPDSRSSKANQVISHRLARIDSMNGIGYLSFTMFSFINSKSTHILNFPFFWGTTTNGATHSPQAGSIIFYFTKSLTYSPINFLCISFTLFYLLFLGTAPGFNFISCSKIFVERSISSWSPKRCQYTLNKFLTFSNFFTDSGT